MLTYNEDSANCLRMAVDFYTDEGRFSMAAKHEKELAELYEAESQFDKASEAFQTAADYYEGENATRFVPSHYCSQL